MGLSRVNIKSQDQGRTSGDRLHLHFPHAPYAIQQIVGAVRRRPARPRSRRRRRRRRRRRPGLLRPRRRASGHGRDEGCTTGSPGPPSLIHVGGSRHTGTGWADSDRQQRGGVGGWGGAPEGWQERAANLFGDQGHSSWIRSAGPGDRVRCRPGTGRATVHAQSKSASIHSVHRRAAGCSRQVARCGAPTSSTFRSPLRSGALRDARVAAERTAHVAALHPRCVAPPIPWRRDAGSAPRPAATRAAHHLSALPGPSGWSARAHTPRRTGRPAPKPRR
jgi:hypothetical protein